MRMTAFPKPPKTENEVQDPELTEFDYIEIGEKIGEALESANEVEITIFFEKKYESFTGIIRSADAHASVLSLDMASAGSVNINIMSIVSVK